jgi:predicted dehydrogenase
VDSARAQAFGHSHGAVRWSADLSEALRWPDVDGVIVCTPNDTHAAIGLAIAKAGKHLLVEKPLATTVPDARRLTAEFSAAGLVLAAAHTHRCYDYGRAVKASLDSGAVGRPVLARLAILGGWIWPDWRAWMIDPVRSGGHALHNGVHLLDLVTWWLAAEPRTVYARGRKQTAGELAIHDYLEMTVNYAGATAICEMSRGHRPQSFGYRELFVAGTDGTLGQDWDGESALLFGEAGLSLLPAAGGNGFAAQFDGWLAAIGGAEPVVSADEAVLSVAMGVATELSIERGEPVEIAEVLAA